MGVWVCGCDDVSAMLNACRDERLLEGTRIYWRLLKD